jgi:hypothetical protein
LVEPGAIPVQPSSHLGKKIASDVAKVFEVIKDHDVKCVDLRFTGPRASCSTSRSNPLKMSYLV